MVTDSASTAVLGNPTAAVAQGSVSSIYVPSSGAWMGFADGTRTYSAIETDLGRTVDIVHEFKHFDSYDTASENFPGTSEQGWINGGRMLLWSWKPRNSSSTINYLWSDVAVGTYDAKIDATADNIVEWQASNPGKKTFMAFHHEPEDDVGVFGTSADYVNSYRRIRDRFTARGVTSIIYTWIMTGYQTRVDFWGPLYPGDAYVDWLGYDPYPSTCTGFSGTNDPFFTAVGEYPGQSGVDDTGKYRFYKWATGVGGGSRDSSTTNDYVKSGDLTKPIMVGEWAASDHPTSPAGIMTPIFQDWKIGIELDRYPQIKAWNYWESGETATCTHRINVTAPTLAAFKATTDLAQLNRPRPY
jgi:hypothetical protein